MLKLSARTSSCGDSLAVVWRREAKEAALTLSSQGMLMSRRDNVRPGDAAASSSATSAALMERSGIPRKVALSMHRHGHCLSKVPR